jgi:hypothetical protein
MHWTYSEYQRQPAWFIEALLIKWGIENEIQKRNGK